MALLGEIIMRSDFFF